MPKKSRGIELILFLAAAVSVISVLLITIFIFKEGFSIIKEYGLFNFILGTKWAPLSGKFGILPMIIGSVCVTIGAIIIGVPIGIATAIFLGELVSEKIARAVRPFVELLAGIPSVVYGFYGLVVIVPLIRKMFGGSGFSVLASSIILGIMILPTIINISEVSIRSVPKEYKEGSLALGATHWQTIKGVILPAARSGIIASVILGMGRAIGETMAVIMVAGNSPKIPKGIFDQVRTLTGNIAIEMGYASGKHAQALFATGIVLFVIIMILNTIANVIARRVGEER
ncbi:phosphate ABC transporter permease subunit PstC [Caldicellulosiruptor naganoensis]|uniref:Phosphate transport system permease protein n=1 Tax=Caldicellulosiruptor naganoensis TaxID=29324 RepID=A0ABY7BDG8_9FIRM|nr:phosphate ABC transporter permease subunit PstC [Caldicellulosiruptor naganoensis]WAM30878.1 phosphate ABC transporter permease subunit PstC [Caldicellulosiruptor naganoensis]